MKKNPLQAVASLVTNMVRPNVPPAVGVTKEVPAKENGITYGSNTPRGHVSLRRLMDRLDHDVTGNMAVRFGADMATGAGYHLSGTNQDTDEGQAALDLVESYFFESNMSALLYRIAVDALATGNCFLTHKKKDGTLRAIDQSTVVNIEVDDDDDPTYYIIEKRPSMDVWQAGTHNTKRVPASEILHLAYQKGDGTPFGTGILNIMERRGLGYYDHAGRLHYKPSQFEQREMIEHVNSQLMWAAVPKHLVNLTNADDDVVANITKNIQDATPLQHIVTNTPTKIDSVSLQPNNKFEALLDYFRDEGVMGSMSPMLTLLQASQTSYAASAVSRDSMWPGIHALQSQIKRFIELKIIKPLLESNGYNWKLHKVSISFGSEQRVSIDTIKDVVDMTADPRFADKVDFEDILDMLRDEGIPLKPTIVDGESQTRHTGRQKRRHTAVMNNTVQNLKQKDERIMNDIHRALRKSNRGA